MPIRPAIPADAEEAAAVLRQSIRDLCVLDHGGDAGLLAQWLANKTPETVRSWIEAPDRLIVVAEEDGVILGVGAASEAGEITLNYVAPEARFRGVSKSIVMALEAYLRSLGHARCSLTSTRTAHAFYLAMGYENAGEEEPGSRPSGQPMGRIL